MKIIQITNCHEPYAVGGAEINAAKIAQSLRGNGYTVKTITLATSKTTGKSFADYVIPVKFFLGFDPWRDTGKRDKLRLTVFKIFDFFNPIYLVRLYRIFRAERPDLILSHNIKGFSVSTWVAAWLCRAKVIHVLHDYYLLCTNCSMTSKKGPCEKQCLKCKVYSHPRRLLSPLVDRFVGVGTHVAAQHSQYFNIKPEQITVIHNAKDSTRSSSMKADNSTLEPGIFRFGFIGRIEDVKGVPLIFDALSRLNVTSSVELILAGREVGQGYLAALALRYPNVKWRHMGFVRPEEFYPLCNAVVVPSNWAEPFPAVAYEPFEYGVPVLGSAIGGISEIVEDGVAGLLFQVGNSEDLAIKMKRLLDDSTLQANLQTGAVNAWPRFSPSQKMIAQYQSLIDMISKQVQ